MLHLSIEISGVDFDPKIHDMVYELIPTFRKERNNKQNQLSDNISSRHLASIPTQEIFSHANNNAPPPSRRREITSFAASSTATAIATNQAPPSPSPLASPVVDRPASPLASFIINPIVRTGRQLVLLDEQLKKKYINILLPRMPNIPKLIQRNDRLSIKMALSRYFYFLLVDERPFLHSDALIIEFLSPNLQYKKEDSSSIPIHLTMNSGSNVDQKDTFLNSLKSVKALFVDKFINNINTNPYQPNHYKELADVYDAKELAKEIKKWKRRAKELKRIAKFNQENPIKNLAKYSDNICEFHGLIQRFVKYEFSLYKPTPSAVVAFSLQEFYGKLVNAMIEKERDLLLLLHHGNEELNVIIREQVDDLPFIISYICDYNFLVKELDDAITKTIITEGCIMGEHKCQVHAEQANMLIEENIKLEIEIKRELRDIFREKKEQLALYWEYCTRELIDSIKKDSHNEALSFTALAQKMKNV